MRSDQFIQLIQGRASVGQPQATLQAREVMSVLLEALSPGELGDLLPQLP